MVCSRYPKECLYYESVLKRKCLRKIKNNVWETKVKWKLIERADFHLRKKLLYRYFNLWVTFLNESYKKKINRRAADSLYQEKLKSKAILGLKRNAEQSWVWLRICRKKHERNLKFRSWHQWKHYTQKRLKVREIKLLANKIREERLRVRFFYLWSFRLREKRSLQAAFEMASVKHAVKLKRKCFNSWKVFTVRRCCKRKIQSLAAACYRDTLVEKAFHSWRTLTARKIRYRNLMEIIRHFHEKYLLQNYLSIWANAYRKLKFERDLFNYNVAIEFHGRKLLARSFWTLQKARENAQQAREKMAEFDHRRGCILLTYYLDLWRERKSMKVACRYMENKAAKLRQTYLTEIFLETLMGKYRERQEERERIREIVAYSNAILVHRAFRGWTEFTRKHRDRRTEIENASDFYLDRMCARSFAKWKIYLLGRRQKKLADDHFEKALLARALTEWQMSAREHRFRIMEAENLERKHNLKLTRNAFGAWRDEFELHKTKLNAALVHSNNSRKTRAFRAWRSYTRKRLTDRNSYNEKLFVLQSCFLKEMVFRWYEMLALKQSLNRKLKKLSARREKRLVGFCFCVWSKFVGKMKAIRQCVRGFPQSYSNLLVEQYLSEWLDRARAKRDFNKKDQLARKTEEKLLKRKFLRKWLAFVCWKRKRLLELSAGRCAPQEKKRELKEAPTGKTLRKKPLIPSYLKTQINCGEFEGEISGNEDTYRVAKPSNWKLPVAGRREAFVSFHS